MHGVKEVKSERKPYEKLTLEEMKEYLEGFMEVHYTDKLSEEVHELMGKVGIFSTDYLNPLLPCYNEACKNHTKRGMGLGVWGETVLITSDDVAITTYFCNECKRISIRSVELENFGRDNKLINLELFDFFHGL